MFTLTILKSENSRIVKEKFKIAKRNPRIVKIEGKFRNHSINISFYQIKILKSHKFYLGVYAIWGDIIGTNLRGRTYKRTQKFILGIPSLSEVVKNQERHFLLIRETHRGCLFALPNWKRWPAWDWLAFFQSSFWHQWCKRRPVR